MDIPGFIVPVCMCDYKSLIPGKYFLCKSQAESLGFFPSQSTFRYISRIITYNIMMAFNVRCILIFMKFFICDFTFFIKRFRCT